MRALALGLLCCASALASAQGVVIPDLRDPALYREPARAGACRVCGEIRSIREVAAGPPESVAPNPSRTTVNNPNDWAVVGAALYLPTGTGRDEQPRVGAVGTPEMAERFSANTYEITVLMDNGERRTVQRRDAMRFRVGQRVTLSGTMMEPL